MPKNEKKEKEAEETAEPAKTKKSPPVFRVVQVEQGPDSKTVFREIGAVWENTSKAGKKFYTMKIGQMRLLLFPAANGDE